MVFLAIYTSISSYSLLPMLNSYWFLGSAYFDNFTYLKSSFKPKLFPIVAIYTIHAAQCFLLKLTITTMKFFGWVQNKFQSGKGKTESNTVSSSHNTFPEPKKEEFNEWPHGLLNIGTFGDSKLPENVESENLQDDDQPLEHELAEFTPEEVSKLENELTKLLSKKPAPKVDGEIANLPLDRFMNCPSSLEVDRRISTSLCSDLNDKEEEDDDINRTIRVILGRCRDACTETKKKSIGKKSISFLFKKMFVCRSGFSPAPSLRDTSQESRMEKLLRTMLTKKVNRQNSSRASSMKKYIEDRQTTKVEREDETEETSNVQGNKWVKTDSEYIVLEI